MVSLEEGLASLNGVSGLPSMESFISMLQQCKKERNLAHAKLLHVHIRMYGLDAHHALGNHLIPVFLECGSMPDAHQVFCRLERRNEHAWTSLIQGYIENWDCQHAFILFQKMQEDGVPPSKYTYPALLKACSKMKCAVRGQEIHMGVIKEGLERDPYVGNTLVDMYAKCGSLAEAQEVFDRLLVRDVVSWNALITGYAEHGLSQEALNSFEQMQLMGVSPSSVTYISGLKACGSLGFIDMGQEMHSEIAKEGYERDSFVCSTLVDMYAKCGLLAEAQEAFDQLPVRDVVMWTALIAGYAEHGFNEDAENCLEQMQLEGVPPNAFSWNAAIMGHAEEGESDRALILYAQMQEQGLLPDTVTFVCILKACGITADLRSGKRYHAQLYSINGLRATEAVVLNALIDMYGKCGNMVDAQHVFNAVPTQDLVRWSALIMGYVSQGEFELVFYLLKRLREEGMQPDGITLLSVLAVCSHAGLVDEGWRCFEGMSKEHDVVPALTHYNCMLDLLGRAGQLDEALAMMQKMPFQPNLVTWSVLLGACQKWGNVELGRQAFDHAVTMDKNHASAFILMSNIFMDVPI